MKFKIAFLVGCGFGVIAFLLLYSRGLLPLLFFVLAVAAAYMARRAASKGPKWRSLCYANYTFAVLTLIYGYILI